MHFCVGEYSKQNKWDNECTFNCNGHSFFMFKHKQIVNTNTCKFTFTIEIKLNMVRNGLYVYTPVWLAYLMHNSVTIHTTHAFFHSNLLQYTFFFGCTGMRCVGRMAAWICCYTLTLNATMYDERKPLFIRYQYIWIYGVCM